MPRKDKSITSRPEPPTSPTSSASSSGTFSVSQSKVKTWRRCRYAYHLRYVEKLRKKTVSRPLYFGRLIHSAIELHANGDDWEDALDVDLTKEKLFAGEREMYEEAIETARIILTEYFLHWEDRDLVYLRRKGKASEHEFEVEIADGIVAVGKIDAFAKAKGMRWIVEHKTFTKVMNDDQRWRNLQSAVYVRVVDMLGWPSVEGLCWDNVRSKAPARPEVLKSGKLSQRQIDTLPTAIYETLKELELDKRDFQHMIEGAVKNRAEYFKRMFTPTKPQVVDMVFDDFVETAREMSELHGKVKSRNIERHCDWCDYESICRAELQGSDADYVREREFYVSKPKE